MSDVKDRIADNGKGAYGVVDENLPKDAAAAVEKAAEEDKNLR